MRLVFWRPCDQYQEHGLVGVEAGDGCAFLHVCPQTAVLATGGGVLVIQKGIPHLFHVGRIVLRVHVGNAGVEEIAFPREEDLPLEPCMVWTGGTAEDVVEEAFLPPGGRYVRVWRLCPAVDVAGRL